MNKWLNPYMALAVGVITVSASAIFVKLADAPAGVIAFYRLFFSVIFLLPIFLWKYVGELKNITKRDWFFSAIAGTFLAFHFILWFESLNYTSVASSTVLVTLQPLFAFLGTYIFFRERLSARAIISGILAVTGSFIISWGDFKISGMALFGDFLALIACALVTAYLLFGQDVRKRVSIITYTFIVYSFSCLTLFIYVLISGDSFTNYAASDWFWFIMLAIFPTLLGHSLFNWAIKYISTNVISMAILFEPIGAAVLAYFVLEEIVTYSQFAGGLLVILSVGYFLRSNRKRRVEPTLPVGGE
ncbi:EamA-like transporter family protein [Bacillus sp. THAF10]|uniref:DMT family transporter n=1 Tax=Bacillus sp. THAF10 TaxID=2587848 RepID=UPI001268CF14|nr:DMT family transporter [Bacillus sp. THAF10]QFT90330.1 EamA-like transporter family protein [Bacillus sp. THAF10]